MTAFFFFTWFFSSLRHLVCFLAPKFDADFPMPLDLSALFYPVPPPVIHHHFPVGFWSVYRRVSFFEYSILLSKRGRT